MFFFMSNPANNNYIFEISFYCALLDCQSNWQVYSFKDRLVSVFANELFRNTVNKI